MKNSFWAVLKAKKRDIKIGEKKRIKQSHSRMSLSGIFDACRCNIKGKIPELVSGSSTHAVVVVKQGNPLLNKRQTARVEDPETSSGITLFDERQTARGFTLIELLVVVLIIGILAAVALPQYQTAVDKTRYSTMFASVKAVKNAEELYYLANGEYTIDMTNFEGDLPSSCNNIGGNTASNCGNMFYIALDGRFVYGGLQKEPGNVLLMWYDKYGGEIHCYAYTANGERAKRLCKSLGGERIAASDNTDCEGACTVYKL